MFLIEIAIDNIYNGSKTHKSLYEFEQHSPISGSIMFLTRFIPFILDDWAFLDAIFWKVEEGNSKCYGVKLAESLLHLLFKHEYTLKFSDELGGENYVADSHNVDQNVIWRKGISTIGDIPQDWYYGNDSYEQERTKVLNLILVLISQHLYFKPEDYLSILNPFCCYFTNKRAPFVKSFFISLMNTVISYDTVGRGIPYFSAATSFDTDVKLIKSIIPVLSALIEYRPPTKENVNELISGGFTSVKLIK